MKILVSGGFGYIGSYVVARLLQCQHRVGILSRRIPEYFSQLTDKVDVYIADISQTINVAMLEEYDCFIHLAAANDVDSTITKVALLNTTLGTKNCLDFCIRNKIPRFFYFSTFQVYGHYKGLISEDTPIQCLNDYAMTHFFAEEYVNLYHQRHGIDFLIARPTNIYGVPMHKGIKRWSLVPNCFCLEAFDTGRVRLKTSGRQKRDFISVFDIAFLTCELIEQFPAFLNQKINLARGHSSSIIEVADMVKKVYNKIYGRKCILEITADDLAHEADFQIDLTKTRILNHSFLPEYDIENEIKKIFHLLGEQ